MTPTHTLLIWMAVAVSLSMGTAAHAGSVQTMGVSEECVAVGGACAATADDLGAYYSNPAGLTQFEAPFLGFNVRRVDTKPLKLIDSDGNHDVARTNRTGTVAYAPTVAGYMPVTERLYAGLALGAPFALSGDWTNRSGIHRYNMADQSLFLIDLSPVLAYRLSDRLSLGLALNITALKQLRLESLIPDTFVTGLALGELAQPTPSSSIAGSVTLETDTDVRLGIPPDRFSSALDEASFTVGAQYKVNDRFRLGATYKHITRAQWEGEVSFDLPVVQGGTPQKTRFSVDVDLPGHLELGWALRIFDRLTWTMDWQRTFWSQTRGFGSPAVVEFQEPLLGLVNRLVIDYDGGNPDALRNGLKFQLNPSVALMLGFAYEERIYKNSNVDVLTYDANLQIFSLGTKFDLRDATGRGWSVVASVQNQHFPRRRIAAGESENLGGLSQPNLSADGTLRFVPNSEEFSFGGDITSMSLSLAYSFSALN